ncbi:hypothetical protein [Actinocatenispora sera]|uniref:Uncharacterized protein n=1 Tax=Actinocatenispora sera TaxID=390989 RepID=A0A810L8I9_9ACTN|nr:hypothetical protein [Actinocatenispora sera]BCJ31557.1 hypothetical protein Asera_56650 [Actinocatenispora sera]
MTGDQQPVPAPRRPADSAGPHRPFGPEVRHEIATIMLLTGAVADAVDVGPDSRARLDQLLTGAATDTIDVSPKSPDSTDSPAPLDQQLPPGGARP